MREARRPVPPRVSRGRTHRDGPSGGLLHPAGRSIGKEREPQAVFGVGRLAAAFAAVVGAGKDGDRNSPGRPAGFVLSERHQTFLAVAQRDRVSQPHQRKNCFFSISASRPQRGTPIPPSPPSPQPCQKYRRAVVIPSTASGRAVKTGARSALPKEGLLPQLVVERLGLRAEDPGISPGVLAVRGVLSVQR